MTDQAFGTTSPAQQTAPADPAPAADPAQPSTHAPAPAPAPAEPEQYAHSSTRPNTAPRQQSREVRKISRFTLDLEAEQNKFLKMFGLEHNVTGSRVMRTMLFLLESDPQFAARVLQEVYDD